MKHDHKEVADKVTNINHFKNENLLTIAEVRKDHLRSVKWSQVEAEFNCKDRLFDKIIAEAKVRETDDLRREVDTQALHNQKPRGYKDPNENTVSHQMLAPLAN